MGFILIYVVNKDMEEAKKIAEYLLQKRLIACVNYIPIKSSFWWKGEIENSSEVVSLLKTKDENFERLKK